MTSPDDQTPAWLSSALRDEAGRHRPDTARMLARIQDGGRPRARAARIGSARLRRAVTTLAAAGTVAAITVVAWQGLPGFGRDGPLPGGPITAGPSAHGPGPASVLSPASPHSARSPVAPRATASTARQRFLAASGAVDPNPNVHWTQENLTLKTDRRLVELAVSVRVARTEAVSSTGSWLTLPREDFDLTVREEPEAVVYGFVLKRGREVPSGQHSFAVHYNHAPGERDGMFDRFTATATAESGGTARVGGGFRTPGQRR